MNKKNFITILLALVALAVQAKEKQIGLEIRAEKGNEKTVEYLEGLK